jgi:hypothetical protein
MNPVQKITIVETKPLYKEGQAANSIELALNDTNAFTLIIGKDQNALRKRGIYIQPDFCLPDLPIFESYLRPDGNANKSRLGKQNRIRAIKFNFSTENSIDPVFSVGIFLTAEILNDFYPNIDFESITEEELTQILQITKYVEPEKAVTGQTKGELPVGMYSTDESNAANVKKHINKCLPAEGMLSVKVDGSSITIFFKSPTDKGICSRNLEKKLDATQLVGYEIEDHIYTKHWNRELSLKGWFCEELQLFYSDAEIEANPKAIKIEEPLKDVDTFVRLGLPVLERFQKYCIENNFTGALRGELNGVGLKGSGNSKNPHAKEPQNIRFFGLDDYSTGVTTRVPMNALSIAQLERELDIKWCDIICEDLFTDYDSISEYCNNYFKDNMIEGLVFRTTADNSVSAKFMNLAYDANK